MSTPESADVTASILTLLGSLRLPETDEEIAAWFRRNEGAAGQDEAESILDLIEREPRTMLEAAIDLVALVDKQDLPNLGIVLLGPLLVTSPLLVADEFERQIQESEAFRTAFARVSMTGVPLEIQKRLNAAMLTAGADPRAVVEYDEDPESE